jgi:hypothetical protein
MANADATTPMIARHTRSSISVTPSSPRFITMRPRLRLIARQAGLDS